MIHLLRFCILKYGILILLVCTVCGKTRAQAQFAKPSSLLWVNTYGNIKLNDKWFIDNQFHFRFQETDQVPVVGQFAQFYARQGVGHIFSKSFNATAGTVFRLDSNPNEIAFDEVKRVSEFRLWHQYQFAIPMNRLYVYHRLRLEHRWSKGFNEDSEYFFRNRFRYMFNVKIPINSRRLEEKTLYIAPEAEIIMQSGQVVGGSPLEDLRLHTSLGYIVNRNVIVASGLMYTFGQSLADGTNYRQRLILRLHLYYFLDRKDFKKPGLPFEFLN